MTTSAEVRSQLIDALHLDLVGPRADDPSHARYRDEALSIAPSKWYLCGFLVPHEAPVEQRSDDDGDDELDQLDRVVAAGDDDNTPEQASARKAFFPSSMGLSVLVPEGIDRLQVKVTWGDYTPFPAVEDSVEDPGVPTTTTQNDDRRQHWQRHARQAELVVALSESHEPRRYDVPSSEGLRVAVSVRRTADVGLVPAGARSVSVFLINQSS